MADSMPAWMHKGPFHLLDPLLWDPTIVEIMARWVDELESVGSIGEAARQFALDEGELPGFNEEALAHFVDHWLGSWWPEHMHVDAVLRNGLAQGFRRAVDLGVPAEVLWVIGKGHVEIGIAESPQQVTILVYTPQPENEGPEPQWGEPSDVSVVRLRREGDDDAEVLESLDGIDVVARRLPNMVVGEASAS